MAEQGADGDSHRGGDDVVQSQTVPESYKVQDKKTPASSHPSSAVSGPNNNHSGNKPDPPPVLRVDDRQRLARERREEREKQLAAREIVWLEREERARLHYEKHLEERKKKLEEQRLKEERRRAAVEEKRRQRLEEDKERHEAVVRRTMERSQKPKQKHNRWSWGGPLHGIPSLHSTDPDRRSVSTMNLSKHVDPVISKRLSSSSATLLNSPDRARRLQLSPWESSVVNRLLTPTHSFLARSKSTAALSGDAASCSPINIMPYKAAHARNLMERPKLFVTTPEGSARRRTIHGTAGYKREKERENVPFHLTSGVRRALSPSHPKARPPASSRLWLPSKSLPHLPGTPRPASSLQPGSIKAQARPLSPGNIRPVKREVKLETEKKDPEKVPLKVANEPALKGRAPLVKVEESTGEEGTPVEAEATPAAPAKAPASAPVPAPASPSVIASPSTKTSVGTTDAEEATRLLTEKRRLAREQREKEEKERREREELERLKREELAQRVAEERTLREEEARRIEAEQAREKEEQLRRQAEEREQLEREEMERIQKQKEELARVHEEAERARQEREERCQREEQERRERKKRLEEIMKRTARTEAKHKNALDQRNGDVAKEAVTEGTAPELPCVTDSPGNGEPVASRLVVTSHQSKETVESLKREELAQRVAEERTLREEEARRIEAEQAREKEEQLRRQAEEREQLEREEMERIQKQKEELARVHEEAERARQEREERCQREEQERRERKKRLEEIMKRTARTEAKHKNALDQRNGDVAKEAVTEGTAPELPCVTDSPGNGEPVASRLVVTSHQSKETVESTPNLEKQPNENGVSIQNETFEEIINLPVGSKPSRLDVTNSASPEIPLNPILAFDDKGQLGPLPQVDGVQTQQTAEVI